MAKNKKSVLKQDVTLIRGAKTGGIKGSDSKPHLGKKAVDAFTKAFDKSKNKGKGGKKDPETSSGKEEPVFDAMNGVGGDSGGRDRPVEGWRKISDGRKNVKSKDSGDGYYMTKDEQRDLVDRYMSEGMSRSTARRKAKDARKGAPKYKAPLKQASSVLVEGARTGGRKGSDSKPLLGPTAVEAFTNSFDDAFNAAKERQKKVRKEVENFDTASNKKGLNDFKGGNMQCANFSNDSRDKLYKANNYEQSWEYKTLKGNNRGSGLNLNSGLKQQAPNSDGKPNSYGLGFDPKAEAQDVNDKMSSLVSNVKNLQKQKQEWVEMSGGGAAGKSFYSAGSKMQYKAALDDIMTKNADVKIDKDGEITFEIMVNDSSQFSDSIEKLGPKKIKASLADISEYVYPVDNMGQLEFLKWKKEALANTKENLDFDESTTKAILSGAIGPDHNINHGNLMSWAMDDANQDGTTFMEHYLETFPEQTFIFDGTIDLDELIETRDEKGEMQEATIAQALKQEIIEYNIERLRRNHNSLAKSKGLNNLSNPSYVLDSVDGRISAKTITGYES